MDNQLLLAAAPLAAIGGLLALLGAIDLTHRKTSDIAGPRALWAVALLAVPFGPVAYLWFGRRQPRPPSN
jgi:hypothetical protein